MKSTSCKISDTKISQLLAKIFLLFIYSYFSTQKSFCLISPWKRNLFLTSSPSDCLLLRRKVKQCQKCWCVTTNASQNTSDPLQEENFGIKMEEWCSWNLSVGFCLCDPGKIIIIPILGDVFHRCWGLCSLYFSFSILNGPAAIEVSHAYQASERKMILHFQMDRAVNCFSKLCLKRWKSQSF